tara:strand:+ start:1821 stop:3050 length:1230 start_codon:yes stop_codon:yes gene_type:complete
MNKSNIMLNLQPYNSDENNLRLERKLITIHSEDRDIKLYPFSNNFEIKLPDTYTNVHSMRLIDISLPINYYTFTNDYQNTQFTFSIIPGDDSENNIYFNILNDLYLSDFKFNVTITSGFYEPEQLQNEILNKMNVSVTNKIKDINKDFFNNIHDNEYNKFNIHYNKITQKLWFGNTQDNFILNFDDKIIYDLSNCNQNNVWEQHTKWGLPSYLGFEKNKYNPKKETEPIFFDYTTNISWLNKDISASNLYYLSAPNIINIIGEKTIYMEIENFNSYDELIPYSKNTNNYSNKKNYSTASTKKTKKSFETQCNNSQNDFSIRNNSAFAKIPIINFPHGNSFESKNGFLNNILLFDPPQEKIQKLKFKFRYHDGRLIDFNNNSFNFSIEFNTLKKELQRITNIRVPQLYNI